MGSRRCLFYMYDRLLCIDSRCDFGLFECWMLRRVDRHFEIRQDVLCDFEFLLEGLIADVGDDLPITQHRWLR